MRISFSSKAFVNPSNSPCFITFRSFKLQHFIFSNSFEKFLNKNHSQSYGGLLLLVHNRVTGSYTRDCFLGSLTPINGNVRKSYFWGRQVPDEVLGPGLVGTEFGGLKSKCGKVAAVMERCNVVHNQVISPSTSIEMARTFASR